MKKKLILLIILISIESCTTDEDLEISKNRIPEEVVANEISDIVIDNEIIQEEVPEEIMSSDVEVVTLGKTNEIQMVFGFKLIKIIDVQVTDPEIKRMVYFVDYDKIVISTDPYTPYNPIIKTYYLYDLSKNRILEQFQFNDIKYAFFKPGDDKNILYSYGIRNDLKYKSYNLLSKEIIEINKDYYLQFETIRDYENFGHLRGSMDYKWAGYSISPWRRLRDGTGGTGYAGDEYTIGMFHKKELIKTFPYVRVVTDGQFNQSPDGKYLALDAGFYRKDIFRDTPPAYKPNPLTKPIYSGTKYDMYQYGVFIYEAVTEDNIEILDDPLVEVLTFPNPEETAAGITEVKSHIFDGSHLHVTPGEEVFWGTAISVKDETVLYRYADFESEVVKNINNEGRMQIIVDRASELETINNVTDYWYYLEDQTGERGWVFGDSHFELVEELPYFLDR